MKRKRTWKRQQQRARRRSIFKKPTLKTSAKKPRTRFKSFFGFGNTKANKRHPLLVFKKGLGNKYKFVSFTSQKKTNLGKGIVTDNIKLKSNPNPNSKDKASYILPRPFITDKSNIVNKKKSWKLDKADSKTINKVKRRKPLKR